MNQLMKIRVESGSIFALSKITDAETGRALPVSHLTLRGNVDTGVFEADVRLVIDELELEAIIKELTVEVRPSEVRKTEEGYREYVYRFPEVTLEELIEESEGE